MPGGAGRWWRRRPRASVTPPGTRASPLSGSRGGVCRGGGGWRHGGAETTKATSAQSPAAGEQRGQHVARGAGTRSRPGGGGRGVTSAVTSLGGRGAAWEAGWARVACASQGAALDTRRRECGGRICHQAGGGRPGAGWEGEAGPGRPARPEATSARFLPFPWACEATLPQGQARSWREGGPRLPAPCGPWEDPRGQQAMTGWRLTRMDVKLTQGPNSSQAGRRGNTSLCE